MKQVKILRIGWVGILVCGVAVFTGSAQAVDPADIEALEASIDNLRGLKADADALLAAVKDAPCDQGVVDGHLAAALGIEASAHAEAGVGIGIGQTSADRDEVFIKYIILVEHWHVKIVTTITIIKALIIEIYEECPFPPGLEPDPAVVDQLLVHAGNLRALRTDALALLDATEASSEEELLDRFDEALGLEQQAMDTAAAAIDYVQSQADSLYLIKWLVIYEHWHIKIIHFVGIIKVTIIQLYEEFAFPVPPPDQSIIAAALAGSANLRALEAQADALVDLVNAAGDAGNCDDPGGLLDQLDAGLGYEELGITELKNVLDLAMADPLLEPSELLQKKIIIIEAWFNVVVIDICIVKWLIIWWEEYIPCPPVPPEPEIDTLKDLRSDLEGDDGAAEALLATVENTYDPFQTPPLWHEALQQEYDSLDRLQAGIDIVQALPGPPSERLKKAIGILEIWQVRVVLEICIIKVSIIRIWEHPPIPAVTTWGLLVMVLLGMVAGTIMYRKWQTVPA